MMDERILGALRPRNFENVGTEDLFRLMMLPDPTDAMMVGIAYGIGLHKAISLLAEGLSEPFEEVAQRIEDLMEAEVERVFIELDLARRSPAAEDDDGASID